MIRSHEVGAFVPEGGPFRIRDFLHKQWCHAGRGLGPEVGSHQGLAGSTRRTLGILG
jgi:hypothetical protein